MAGKREDGTGRPGGQTKLTLIRLRNIVTVLQAGNYVGTACEFAGIGRTSFDTWRQRGEREMDRVNALRGVDADQLLEHFYGKDPQVLDSNDNPMDRQSPEYMWNRKPPRFKVEEWPYVVFQYQVTRARAAAEVRALHQINSAMGDSWQAAAWFLERTRQDKYGRQQRINLEGSQEGEPIKVVTTDDLEAKLGKLLGG